MRRAAALVLTLAALVAPASAAEWSTIIPAVSTMESVRAFFGGPTRSETQKLDHYDTVRWVYEGAQAPTGMTRMVVEFGMLQAGGFKRDVVRTFRLEPNPGVFTRDTILRGWGRPDGHSKEGGTDSFFYSEGLLVVFDKESWSAVTMTFTPPQPATGGRPSR